MRSPGNYRGEDTTLDKPVRGLDGRTLTKPVDQLESWKEHFSRLLSGKPVEHLLDIEAGEELHESHHYRRDI